MIANVFLALVMMVVCVAIQCVIVAVMLRSLMALDRRQLITPTLVRVSSLLGGVLLIMLAGTGPATPPVITGEEVGPIADPLPQAMVLTAIVIAFGITAFLLALALRSYLLTGTDAVEDDIEDRRIGRFGQADREATT